MPSKTAALEPPVIEKPKATEPEFQPEKYEPPPREHPEVTTWADKLNERVSHPWEEHELRAGRAFPMPGATMAEAQELCDVFKLWSTGICTHDGSPCILIKPSSNTHMPKRPTFGQKPGR